MRKKTRTLRTKKPPRDENVAAFSVMQRIIERSEGRNTRFKGREAYKGYLPFPPMTRIEAVVYLIAHELPLLHPAPI